MHPNANSFVNEFIRIAELLPQEGLILDVRGNGGGNILAGERLLQLLTPCMIEPERLHFLNTPVTLELCSLAGEGMDRWRDSITMAVETGETFSQGFPLDRVETYNSIGQKYQGPVVLVTDALCYSTTDIFAAGFQDHRIGFIIGTSGHTGAGGANVWDYSLLRTLLPVHFKQLPQKTSFRVAIRRTTRVGEQAGVPIEDLGVVPDAIYLMTKNDILRRNEDMINEAGRILDQKKVYSLRAEVSRTSQSTVTIRATTKNLSRVDIYLGHRPEGYRNIKGEITTIKLSGIPAGPHVLELRGFDGEEPAASTRIPLGG